MAKLAFGSWAFAGASQGQPLSFHSVLHGLEESGYEGVELGAFPPHPTPESHPHAHKREHVKREVSTHGLAFSALVPDLRGQKVVSVEDGGPFVAAFEKALSFASDLGIGTVRLDAAEPAEQVKGIDPGLALDRAAKAFGECARLAGERGIRVAWEFEPALAINTPDEIVALVDAVRGSHANFGALFDTCNAHVCAAGAEADLLRRLVGKIAHVHVADSDGTGAHLPPGRGKMDLGRLLSELQAAGVDSGWWCVDLGGYPDAWDALAECRRSLDNLRKT
jgi:sugar phosphate isomerase/epimerase